MPTTRAELMHPTRNDLSESIRSQMVGLLNARLADAIDLKLHAKQAHWNVRGPHFIGLHELFDQVATEADGYSDEIAERAAALGGLVDGTAQAVAGESTLPSYPLDARGGEDHVVAVSAALATFGKNVREGIDTADQAGDADTADLLTAISRQVDKSLWFVEAHLERDHG